MAAHWQIIDDEKLWEDFVLTQDQANFLQSWYWGEMQQNLGRTVFRSGLLDGGKLIAVSLAVVEPARRGRYLAVAAGPLLDWTNEQQRQSWKEHISELAQQQRCVFIRVRPQAESTPEGLQTMKALGFKPAQMHLEAELTSQLDITEELDAIRKNFRKNTRYALKQAKKQGVQITESTDVADIDAFYDLQLQTAQRHGFVPFSKARLRAEFEAFAANDMVRLYTAKTAEGELIAQAFVVFYGAEASYHYGASTELGRTVPGAYALMWRAMQDAKARGQKRYNFWGVVKEDEKDHRFYGVSVFKRGFRGQDIEYIHAHDLVLNRIAYLKNYIIEFARKRLRNV